MRPNAILLVFATLLSSAPLSSAPVLAAPSPHIYMDLSGPWTRIAAGLPPSAFSLPRATLQSGGAYVLQREIQLPESGLDGLAILMTVLGPSYDIEVNGQSIGELKSSSRFLAPLTVDAVFPVPDGLLHPGANQIRLKLEPIRILEQATARLNRSGGPLLGGFVELEAIAEGRQRTNEIRHAISPINTVAEALFCAILLLLARGSRYRKALLWVAFFFAVTAVCFDLPRSLEIFAITSRTLLDWLFPVIWFLWPMALTEAALALLALAPPWWLRTSFYALVSLGMVFLHPRMPVFFMLLLVFSLLLVQAIRRRNHIAMGFLWLQVGYWFLHVAVTPPWTLLPVPSAVPAYRVIIGLGLIVMVVRQSVGDRNERQRLATELAAARAVQQVLFPDATNGNIDAVYRPAAEVGGDFWQAIPTKDGAQILAIGDVSGKGLKAAMIVSLLTGALRNRQSDKPAAILGELNRVAASLSGGGFVTAAVARVDGASVTIANAGHPQPWLNRCEVNLEPGLPLGIDAETAYTEREIPLDGQLVFVSDGVIEAANPSGELFGFERVGEISAKSAHEIAEAARAWGQNDDITVVTVRRSLA